MKRFLWLLLIVPGLAGTLWFLFFRGDERQNATHAREVATRVMAEYLAAKYPAHHALVISNPFTQTGDVAGEILKMEQAGISGLKKGFGAGATLEVVFPELKPEAQTNPRALFIDGQTTTPLSYLVADDAFDKLAAKHPNCDVLVSLIGLPAALNSSQCWTRSEKPRFALLLPDLRFVGDSVAVQRAVKSRKLTAFVLNKPGALDSRVAPKGDLRTEFDKRFVLVTPENIDQILETYPQLFKARS